MKIAAYKTLFSVKEFPFLIIGSIWKHGAFCHLRSKVFHVGSVTLEAIDVNKNLRNDIQKYKTYSNFKDILPDIIWQMPGITFPFKIKDKEYTAFLSSNEIIRAYYGESQSTSHSCFHGKHIYDLKDTLQLKKSKEFENKAVVVLKDQIEDERANFAYRLFSDKTFRDNYSSISRQIRYSKGKAFPKVGLPFNGETRLSFSGFVFSTRSFFVSRLLSCSKAFFTEDQVFFGRLNDGRKGQNSSDPALLNVEGGHITVSPNDVDITPNIKNSPAAPVNMGFDKESIDAPIMNLIMLLKKNLKK